MPARAVRAATRRDSDRGIVRRAMTEAEVLRTLTDACQAAGLLWHHRADPKRCSRCGHFDRPTDQPGLPDLLVVQAPVLHALELKTESGSPSLAQREWLAQLAACTEVDARIVKPRHLDACIRTLLDGRAR